MVPSVDDIVHLTSIGSHMIWFKESVAKGTHDMFHEPTTRNVQENWISPHLLYAKSNQWWFEIISEKIIKIRRLNKQLN